MTASRLSLGLRLFLLGLLAIGLRAATAHEISMAEMSLQQASPTEFLWQWTAGNRTGEAVLRPRWPQGCADQDGVLRCGPDGLSGRLGMAGVGQRFSAVLVKVTWLDGRSSLYTLTKAQPEVQVFNGPDDRRGMGEIATAYAVLGVEHILAGIDHLLFVIGLLFLVGFNRRLVGTITAFTAAHSLTLALAALGLLTLRPPPVEASIALSIVLVAREGLHRETTLSRRWPALVAFLFGLVHGLGFAGALEQIGLPQNHLAVALLTFNLGVEAGQLLVVAAAWALWKVLPGAWRQRGRVPALYAIGGLAACWAIERVGAVVAG
ncbi:HupE/UreJ family protein [Aquabacterium sp. J223]|uniref:HupE/UreJ family protein n=1 Tax=Aquabacterium sp. J223 TaxID=2898431 RepID=UPI0021ADEE55|nr:HupE/UreJ family protein [Aquabacterium sp. J223]UUX94461.1 HupE/UreJ family protein [Aquabacterium sp. J223]